MKTARLILILTSSALLAGHASGTLAAACADEAQLRDLKTRQWPAYYRTQDVAGLSAFLTEDFRVVDADGVSEDRASVLDWVKKNPWNPTNFRYEVRTVTCPTADTALIIGEGGYDRTQDGHTFREFYTSSNVFVKKDGHWRVALSHLSGTRSEPSVK